MDFSILDEHPDKEEIISKLMNGASPKEVSQWLKLKYPEKDQSHLRITIKLLKEFVDSGFTDCHQQFNQDLQAARDNVGGALTTIPPSLLNNKTYKERLKEIAAKEIDIVDKEIDIKNMLKSLIVVCYERAEQVFDQIQINPKSFKGDRVLLAYFNELFNMVEKFEKIINNAPDQIIQHNYTMQTVDLTTNIILEAIRRTLAKFDGPTALAVMEELSMELNQLKAPSVESMTQEERMQEANVLEEKIITFTQES
jgi:hypothetical protein